MSLAVNSSETRTLGDFVLREKLGEGGFGTVYRAEQRTLDRSAVVKVMRPSLVTRSDASERFILEARLASRFDHPYAAHVYAFGAEPDGVLWIAMEWVRGTPLGELIARSGPLPLDRFVPLMERLCDVVQSAHDQGIVHRDIKPSNVMVIARSGRLIPKLLDFGIAKLIGLDVASSRTSARSDADVCSAVGTASSPEGPLAATALSETSTASRSRLPPRPAGAPPQTLTVDPGSASPIQSYPPGLTRAGQLLGSPPYMSPEQWLDPARVGPRADQYALALLAFEALTGARPYAATTIEQLADCHMHVALPALPQGLPAAVHAVLARAAAKDPELRFANLHELAAALRAAAGFAASLDERNEHPHDNRIELPGELHALWIAEAPRPIAEAVASLLAAQTPARVADRVLAVASTLAHWLGVLAIACRSRMGSFPGASDDVELVRALRRRPLRDEEWLDLATALARPFGDRPEAWPLPEHAAFVTGDAIRALRGLIRGDPGVAVIATDGAEPERSLARDRIARLAAVLGDLGWLLDYEIGRELPGGLELWMGVRSDESVVRGGSGGEGLGRLIVLDGDGAQVVALSSVARIMPPAAGAPDELFLLRGPGRGETSARFVASPRGFEREVDDAWSWLAAGVLDAAPAAAAEADERPPYPGLTAFTRADHTSFVGREREVEDVINRLRTQRALAVVGPSGAGKSSFLAAGIVPALPDTWAAELIRPGQDPVAVLTTIIGGRQAGPYRDELHPSTRSPDATASGLVARAARSAEVLIVIVDQAEELFTMCSDPAERIAFAGVLAAAWTSPRIRVVLGLRDDFLCRLDDLAPWRGVLGRAVHILRVPNAGELERIVTVPARRRGYDFDDPDLPRRIAGEVAERPGALPLLAFAAAELWAQRDRHFKRLTRAAYDRIGGVVGALVQHADGVVDAMPAKDRRLVRLAFGRLLTASGTRTVLGRDELVAAMAAPAAASVVERLLAARLIVSRDDDTGDRVEIVHEALATMWPRLAAWRREDAAGIQIHEQLAAAARHWDERGRSAGLLWRGDALDDLRRLRGHAELSLTPTEAAFAAASETWARAARRRRLGAIAAAFGVLAIALAVLGVLNQRIAHQRSEAVRQVAAGLEERGRLAILGDDALHGLVYLAAAQRLGQRGVAIDLLTARAAATVESQVEVIASGLGAISRAELDASTIVTVGDGVARVWDRSRAVLATSPLDDILDAALADGSIVLLSRAGDLSMIDPSGAPHWRLPRAQPAGPGARWAELTLHAAAHLVVSSRGIAAQVRRLDDGALVAELRAAAPIKTAVFDAAGTRVATGDIAGEIRVWTLPAGALVATCTGHTATIEEIRFSSRGDLLISASDDRDIRICDPATGQSRLRLQGHTNRVLTIDLAPDGTTLVSGSSDGTARLWDTRAGNLLATLDGHHGVVEKAQFSPDGRLVATVGADGSARISDLAGIALASLEGHAGRLKSVRWEPDGHHIITAGFDGSIRRWDVDRALVASSAQRHAVPITALAVSRDGRWSATGDTSGRVEVWDIAAGAPRITLVAPGPINTLWFAPDSAALVAVDRAGTASLWAIPDGRQIRQLGAQITTAMFTPDGRAVLTGGGDHTVRLWNRDGAELARITVDAVPAGFTFDPDGRWAVFRPTWTDPSTDATVIDLAAARVVAKLHGDHSGVAAAIDRTRIATADGSQIRIWQLGTWRLVATLSGHTSNCNQLMFLPDGRLVSTGNDLRAFVWSSEYAVLAALPIAGIRVSDMDATSDGALLVTDGADGAARIWDTATYRELLRLPSHHQALERLRLTPDDQRLLTAGADGRVVTWDLRRAPRSQDEIDRLVRCRVPLRLDGDLALPRELDLHDPTCR